MKSLGLRCLTSLLELLGDEACYRIQAVDNLESALGAENCNYLGQAISHDAARGHDCNALPADEAHSGLRVNEGRIALALNLEILLGVAGSRNGFISKQKIQTWLVIWILKLRNPNFPTLC